jgi:DNA-binding MarR family transcriptional regulator
MDGGKLRETMTDLLQRLYDMEVLSALMEFCQGELRVLMHLNAQGNADVFPSDLSEALFVTRQRITSILSSLRNKGLVSMELAENDRRRMRVKLTDLGRTYVESKKSLADRYLETYIEVLGRKTSPN